jgi:hypothetical protein
MERPNNLASCLIHNGTVTNPRDMVRALETLETLTYRQTVDGELMAEPGSSTILVNQCLFINVLSFRYLTFNTAEDGTCVFELNSDGMALTMVPVDDPEGAEERLPTLLMESEDFEPGTYVVLDDDEDEDGLR